MPWFKPRPQEICRTTGVGAFALPVQNVETVFGTVQVLPNRYLVDTQAVLAKMKRDLEMTLLSDDPNPPGWSQERLERIEELRQSYTPGWLLPNDQRAGVPALPSQS